MEVALFEKVFAAIVLVACVAFGLRLAIGPERIARVLRWRAVRRTAEREARSAIERARRSGSPADGNWDGNVYRPKNFRRPKKPH